ncbi:MAG TPA: BadF/BadG/BcrA/BcrD ATPase family protein [Mycobacteriales bacterium]|nr:BadF/BadG/BcrA/BcrD ATPase family protein [Mycobacteriales bacterium]
MQEPVVIGIDAGGTNVRALVCDGSGTRLGTGTATGANPTSRGPEAAAATIGVALAGALSTVDASRVGRAVIGAAGSVAQGTELAVELKKVWAGAGLACSFELRSDLEVAFAAGRPDESGVVVLAGTGAAVAEIRSGRMVRCLDGAGWLLGDVGSGFWLGREAVRAALAHLDGTGESTVLAAAIAAALGVPEEKWPVVRAVYAREPLELAALAPLVGSAAAEGDAVAGRIVVTAVDTLVSEAAILLHDTPDLTAAVLAGGVLLAGGELAERVGMALTTEHALAVGLARDGAAGAAWLAMRESGAPPVEVHAALTA